MRSLIIVCLLGLSAGPLTADDSGSKPQLVRAKLRAQAAIDVAWGLHDAIESRLPGLDTLVLDVLDRALAARVVDDRLLLRPAVDAVIELGIGLPPERTRKLLPELSPTTRLILAARDPQGFRDVLRPFLTATGDDDGWTAACNLLTSIRDSVATAHLVGRLRLRARVTVHDLSPRDPPFGSCSLGVFGGGHACGRVESSTREGWPPRFYWVLRSSPNGVARLIAPGREPIYAERRELVEGGFVCSSMACPWARDHDAERYVADLLGWDASKLSASLSSYRYVGFTGVEAYEKELKRIRCDLLRSWVHILAGCCVRGLLSPRQLLALSTPIKITVEDVREVKDPALPGTSADD